MPRIGLRTQKVNDSDSEEFQTDLKYATEKQKESQIDGSEDGEEVSDSDVSLQEEGDDSERGDKSLSDSDEDMPESVPFAKSQQSALEKIKEAMQQISGDKKRKKEKRRLINERNTEAKRKRLEALAKAKLPDDILTEIPSQMEKTPRNPERSSLGRLDSSQDVPDVDNRHPSSDSDRDDELVINQEYIPLNYDRFGGVTVETGKQVSQKQRSLAQSALEFRNKSLYNQRIQRETAKKRNAKREKRKARFL